MYRNAVYSGAVNDAPEIKVLMMPKFEAEATALIGMEGIRAVAVHLIDHPNAGDLMSGGPLRKLRWGAKGKVKRGGARIIYVYAEIAARIYLLGCQGERRQSRSDGQAKRKN